MKLIIALIFISSVACAKPNAPKKILPVLKEEVVVKNKKLQEIEKKEEDCDKKAEKPIEIIPESMSLSGNAGCSLDEAH